MAKEEVDELKILDDIVEAAEIATAEAEASMKLAKERAGAIEKAAEEGKKRAAKEAKKEAEVVAKAIKDAEEKGAEKQQKERIAEIARLAAEAKANLEEKQREVAGKLHEAEVKAAEEVVAVKKNAEELAKKKATEAKKAVA